TQVLSNAVRELLSKYPTARVQIVDDHYEDLLNGLRAGKLDLLFGVLRRPDWAADVKEELLFANPLRRCRPHRSSVIQDQPAATKHAQPARMDHAGTNGAATKSVASHFGEPFDGTKGQHRNDIVANIPDDTCRD